MVQGMDDFEIWRAAREMRKRYGKDAAPQAAKRADRMLDQGNQVGFRVWERVIAAIKELESTGRRDGEGTR